MKPTNLGGLLSRLSTLINFNRSQQASLLKKIKKRKPWEPVIVSDTSDVRTSSKRIIAGKTMNAGQICLAPDYVLIPENKLDQFISHVKETVTDLFPTIKDNDDYTSVINERHYSRLTSYIDEAKEKGCEIIEINMKPPIERDKIPPSSARRFRMKI